MYFDKKYRPKKLSQFQGNEEVKSQIKTFKKNLPSLILLHGTTGCGKTTLARIIADRLKFEVINYNVSHAGGIELARYINESSQNTSLLSNGKAYILNEMQGANKQCMNALLEVFEEPPKNTVFIMCTTEPQKLLDATKSRATILEVKPLNQEESIQLLGNVCSGENLIISERTLTDIFFASKGIPRKMLIALNAVAQAKNKEDIPRIIENYGSIDEGSKQAIDLCRSLYKKDSFKVVMQKLKEVEDSPETIKRVVCSYMSKILMSGKLDKQAILILEIFIKAEAYFMGMPAIVHAITILYV